MNLNLPSWRKSIKYLGILPLQSGWLALIQMENEYSAEDHYNLWKHKPYITFFLNLSKSTTYYRKFVKP